MLTRGGGHLPVEEDRHGVVVHRVARAAVPQGRRARSCAGSAAMNDDMRALGVELCERVEFDARALARLAGGGAPRERLARELALPWITTVHATEYGRHQGWVQQAPAVAHPRRRAVDGPPRRPRDHLLALHARPRRRACSGSARRQDHRDPERDRPARPASRSSDDLPALRARFARPDQRLVLLVGRLVYEKGFHLALDALAPVVKRLGDVRFVVAGTGHRRGRAQTPGPAAGAPQARLVPRLGRRRHAALALPRRRGRDRAVDLRAVRARRARGDGLRLPVRGRRHRRPARGRPRRRHRRAPLPFARRRRAASRCSSGC